MSKYTEPCKQNDGGKCAVLANKKCCNGERRDISTCPCYSPVKEKGNT